MRTVVYLRPLDHHYKALLAVGLDISREDLESLLRGTGQIIAAAILQFGQVLFGEKAHYTSRMYAVHF